MEEIKIVFFVLGTLFGNDHSRIAAEKATVTIDPEARTIAIVQEDLFAFIRTEEDSLSVRRELTKMIKGEVIWRPELADYPTKRYQVYVGDNGTLNARVLLEYNTNEDLEACGLHVNPKGFFSMTDFPEDNLRTKDGRLRGRYWQFDTGEPFTFSLEPNGDIPEEIQVYKKKLLPLMESER